MRTEWRTDQHEACQEFVDIGPFRFECDGHLPGARRRAIEYHGGKLEHHATSPQDVGDVDVTFYSWVECESDYERRKLLARRLSGREQLILRARYVPCIRHGRLSRPDRCNECDRSVARDPWP